MNEPTWTFNDGGRAAAGFKGTTSDCVCRAIAIATSRTYREVYNTLNKLAKHGKQKDGENFSARTGMPRRFYQAYLEGLGWEWVPAMRIGSGCTVHLCREELPPGRLLVKVSRHLVAVIDGVIHDTHDPARAGNRCVYGYWKEGRR